MPGLEEARRAQREAALALANERKAHAQRLRKALRTGEHPAGGEVDYDALLMGQDELLEDAVALMPLEKLLPAIPGIGKVAMYEVCRELNVLPIEKPGDLSPVQREDLARFVRMCRGLQSPSW